MKRLYKIPVFLIFSIVFFTACNEDLPWNEEQYEKMIYLQSNTDKIYAVEYHFDGSQNEKTISILSSGTYPTEQDVEVVVEEDLVLFDKFNLSNFDNDETKYAKKLAKDRFSMPVMVVTLKKGENSVQLPIIMGEEGLKGLSPDSIYFIPINIKSVSAYSINVSKCNLLYRVYAKNDYASTKTYTTYSLKGYRKAGNNTQASISFPEKVFHPLSKNEVRMFVGTEPFKAELQKINSMGVKIKINENNSLTLSPYDTENGGLVIEQLDPPTDPEDSDILYNNTYEPNSKRFKMYYRYKLAGSNEWITMKEIDALTTELE